MKKKIMALFLACTILAGMLMGCSSAEKAEETNTGKELKDFTVILDWYPNAIHSFMYLAQEKGYFAEEGLNVILTPPAGYSDGLTFPAAGKAEVGMYYMSDSAVGYADEDMDIQVIGAVTQANLSCMISMKDSNILSPKDFKGKKVGYCSEGNKKQIITCAKNCGVAEDEFELIDVGFDIETAIISGTVDVVGGGMVNHEVVELENQGYGIDYWFLEDYGVPETYDIIFVANQSAYKADSALYEGFLRACKKGFEDVKADPAAALDLLFQHEDAENYALSRDVEDKSIQVLLDIEEKSGQEFLSMSADRWNGEIQWLKENGLLKNDVEATDFCNVQ